MGMRRLRERRGRRERNEDFKLFGACLRMLGDLGIDFVQGKKKNHLSLRCLDVPACIFPSHECTEKFLVKHTHIHLFLRLISK